jgi:hypothetical protein
MFSKIPIFNTVLKAIGKVTENLVEKVSGQPKPFAHSCNKVD